MSRGREDPFFSQLSRDAIQPIVFPDAERTMPRRRRPDDDFDERDSRELDRYRDRDERDDDRYRDRNERDDDRRPARRDRRDRYDGYEDDRPRDERDDMRYDRRPPRRQLEPPRRSPTPQQRQAYLPVAATTLGRQPTRRHNRVMRWGIETRDWVQQHRYKATAIGGVAIIGISALIPKLDNIGDTLLKNDMCANSEACSSVLGSLGTPNIRSEVRLPDLDKPGKRLGSTATYTIVDITREGGKESKVPIAKRNILVGVDISFDKDQLDPLVREISNSSVSAANLSGPLYTTMAAQFDNKDECIADLINIVNVAKRHSNDFLGNDSEYLNIKSFKNADNIYDTMANHPGQKDDPNIPNIIVVSGMLPKNPAEVAKKKAAGQQIPIKDYVGASLGQSGKVERGRLTCGLKL